MWCRQETSTEKRIMTRNKEPTIRNCSHGANIYSAPLFRLTLIQPKLKRFFKFLPADQNKMIIVV
jgi:hypothetical protein